MTAAAVRHTPVDFLGARLGEYGAAELKRLHPVYLRRALALACLLALTAVTLALLAAGMLGDRALVRAPIVVHLHDIAPPPSVVENRLTPIAVAPGAAPPIFAVPVPVPNAEAPLDRTTAKQEDFRLADPSPTPADGPPAVVVIPDLPDPGPEEFVYVEELPVPITQVMPEYPGIALQSGLQGTVLVRALVDTNGRVKDVAVEKSIPILDDAALAAVRQWVFKPALSNNRPVKVWVRVPVSFRID